MKCDCCKRELTVTDTGFVGHQLDGWHSAKGMLFGTYWCSNCAGKHKPSPLKPDWLDDPKPLYSRQESAEIADRLLVWLTRLQPFYDRSRWDYAIRTGWTMRDSAKRSVKAIGTLTLQTENGTVELKPLIESYTLRMATTRDQRNPEFVWKHFGKALANLFRSLQPADGKRLRALWKSSF